MKVEHQDYKGHPCVVFIEEGKSPKFVGFSKVKLILEHLPEVQKIMTKDAYMSK